MISAPSFLLDLLRLDAVAQALAHLAALAVDGEAVRQQAAIGRAAVHRAGRCSSEEWNQPRCWSWPSRYRSASGPLSSWPRAGGARACRAARGRRSSRSRTRLRGCRCSWCSAPASVARRGSSSAVTRLQASMPPCSTMPAARSRIAIVSRVQLARVLVQEEGQRHAPAALAADAPVGPVGDHVAQPRAAVLRDRSWCRRWPPAPVWRSVLRRLVLA